MMKHKLKLLHSEDDLIQKNAPSSASWEYANLTTSINGITDLLKRFYENSDSFKALEKQVHLLSECTIKIKIR